jgi:hypothetical protein
MSRARIVAAPLDRSVQVKSLLDPTFRYVPSTQTDIRKTFARVRKEMRQRTRDPEGLPPPKLTVLFPAQKRAG